MMDNTKVTVYKYSEDQLVDELKAYIGKTYGGHYVGDNNIQAIDLIFAAGHGKGFCVGNILKYASRYGKKKGHNKDDLMKILHYAILLLYVHNTEQEGVPVANSVLDTTPRIVTGYIQPMKPEDIKIAWDQAFPIKDSAADVPMRPQGIGSAEMIVKPAFAYDPSVIGKNK